MVEPATGDKRRHATWLLAGGVGQAALAFGANLVLVRHIAPEGFGRFALAFATVTAVLSVLSLRLGALVVRSESQDDETRRLYWSAACLETLAAGALAALVLAVSGGADGWGVVLLVACLLKHTATTASGFLERRGAWTRLAGLEGGAQLAGHALATALALGGLGVGALVLRELALGVVSLSLLRAAGGLPRVRPRWVTSAEWRRLAREAKDLWLDGALEGLFSRTMVLAAGLLGGERGAGLFAQAHRLAMVPHQFVSPLAGRLAFAWFARVQDRRALRRKLAALMAGPLILAAVGALALGNVVVPIVLGRDWNEAAPLLSALFGIVIGTSLLALVKTQFQAERKLRPLLTTRAIQFVTLGAGVLAGHAQAASDSSALVVLCLALSTGALVSIVVGWVELERQAPHRARSDSDPSAERPTGSLEPPAVTPREPAPSMPLVRSR